MKLKILIVPLLLVAIIAFSIWVLAPSYFTVKEEVGKLDEANQKANDIKSKLEKASKLSQELTKRGEEQKIITEYLPENKEEEKVVNYFNDLVLRQGMTILDFSIAPKVSQLAVPLTDASGIPVEIDTTPAVQYVNVDFTVAGTYEKIKDFLSKLDSIKRLNSISKISISKGSANESEAPSSGNLIAEVTTGFGYLEKIKTVSNINNKALASEKFDLSIIDYLKNSNNTEITELNLDAAGKNDPFTP